MAKHVKKDINKKKKKGGAKNNKPNREEEKELKPQIAPEEKIKPELEEKAKSEQVTEKKPMYGEQQEEKTQSEEVKPSAEVKESGVSNIFDKMLDVFSYAYGGAGAFFILLGKTAELLLENMKGELYASWLSIHNSAEWIKKHIGHKMDAYYEENPDKLKERYQKNRRMMRKLVTARKSFREKEREAAGKMAHIITHVDDKNEEISEKTNIIVKKSNRRYNFAREWAETNKKKLILIFTACVIAAIGGVSIVNYCTAYEYAYNGRTLGMVKSQEDVLKIVDIVSEQLSKEHNAEISIDKEEDISFKRVFALNENIDDTEQVLKRLTYMRDMTAKGYAIYVGDTRAAIVDSEETAQNILETIKNSYLVTSGDVAYEKINIKEDISIKKIETKLGNLQNVDDVINKLMTGAVYQQVHTVEAGDTLSGVAKKYDIALDDLKEANPTVNPERLSIGQQLILTKPAPMITVETVEVATYIAAIPHETEYQDSSALYKGETNTKVVGVDGEKQVTARIVRENGIQVSAEELSSTVISEPVTEVIVRGTKAVPPKEGTGRLIYPVSGYRLTSKFGPRWGRNHNGLDMACSTGTKIVAADGGTVIFSGYSGSYGYVVKISHGRNMVTVYAHCSKLFVKKGDRVFQGQHIANVGSTGRSTGPHLHFEVQINGVAKNPFGYLP